MRRLIASLPSLALCATYALHLWTGTELLGADLHSLGRVLQIELLVIHSFPFVGGIALSRPATDKGLALKWAAFLGASALYVAGAFQFGWPALVQFLGLTATTYGGLFLNLKSREAVGELIARWAGSWVAFVGSALVSGAPRAVETWDGARETLPFGLLYFLILATLELSGIYDLPRLRRTAAQIFDGLLSGVKRRVPSRTGPPPSSEMRDIPTAVRAWWAASPLISTAAVIAIPYLLVPPLLAALRRVSSAEFVQFDPEPSMRVLVPLLITVAFASVRAWHARVVLRKLAESRRNAVHRQEPSARGLTVMVMVSMSVVYGLAGLLAYGEGVRVSSRTWFPIEALGAHGVLDLLVLLYLTPLTWLAFGNDPPIEKFRSRQRS